MSNIVLATSLIELASEQAGCSMDDDATCDNKVYGFSPTSLISNIAVISFLLSALFMPMIGAIVDYTPYRRATGIVAALLMGCIQAAQIGTVSSTWFAMALLQALAGFIYQVEVVATYAYLPDISRTVGQDKMTTYSSKFLLIQFTAQCLFLILVGAVSLGADLDNVVTAQMSQAVNCVWIAVFFTWGWRMLPSAPARHTLHDGHSLWTEGFKQNCKTIKTIQQDYKHGLRWFLLATTFAEACTYHNVMYRTVCLSNRYNECTPTTHHRLFV
jgi:MFS-type transporter involved in bile tolerance (Atg22 family)